MLEDGQKTPIMVRDDGKRLILVEGLQRIEAAKTSGRGNHRRHQGSGAAAVDCRPVIITEEPHAEVVEV